MVFCALMTVMDYSPENVWKIWNKSINFALNNKHFDYDRLCVNKNASKR